jgi:5-methylcytosine-specific restriction endonuclease McrA
VINKTGGKCFYCGSELKSQDYFDEGGKVAMTVSLWAVDHFFPLSKGGSYELSNLVPACNPCNSTKSARTIEQFRQVFGKEFYFEIQGLTP